MAHWEDNTQKDDVTIFLENYEFTPYDDILNIADLMATSHAIVSPAERIADIATRRKEFDKANRGYFLAELTNKLVELLEKIGGKVPADIKPEIKATKDTTLEEITAKFEKVSKLFFDEYEKNVKSSSKNEPENIIEIFDSNDGR
jgi:hypothetical protein